MRVILQQDVANLGKVGDQVVVKRGYGRNYLIPQEKAVRASRENIERFEVQRVEFEQKAQRMLEIAKERVQQLEESVISIATTAGEGGKLFGSIGPRDIAEAAVAAGIQLEKREVSMPEGPIRQIGEYQVTINLHSSVVALLKVNVVPQ